MSLSNSLTTFESDSKQKMKQTRNTVARSAILALIQSSEVALSQLAIQQTLNGLCDRVTIYRVLERLVEEGMIHKIVNVNGVVNFAACATCSHEKTHQHQHIHFSCRVCSELTCLNQVVPSFDLPSGFSKEETFFTVSGICNNCHLQA